MAQMVFKLFVISELVSSTEMAHYYSMASKSRHRVSVPTRVVSLFFSGHSAPPSLFSRGINTPEDGDGTTVAFPDAHESLTMLM